MHASIKRVYVPSCFAVGLRPSHLFSFDEVIQQTGYRQNVDFDFYGWIFETEFPRFYSDIIRDIQ